MNRYDALGRRVGLMFLTLGLTFAWSFAAAAATTGDNEGSRARSPVWSINGDLAGQLQVMTTAYEDTFAEIGSQRSFGYLELVKANPGIDPWLPGEGTRITLPRHYVLPDGPREGIVINLSEYRLYYFRDGGVQVFPVGIGREEAPSPITNAEVTMRLESPAWYPPPGVRARAEAEGEYLPRMVPPGPDNPLGSHALLLSAQSYLIHGTNNRFGIGMQVSAGCFRMYNEDISRFVYEVDKGTPVNVIRQPVKIGMRGDQLWLEVHRFGEDYPDSERDELWKTTAELLRAYTEKVPGLEVQRAAVELAVDQADGLPRMIGERVAQMASRSESQGSSGAGAGAARSADSETGSPEQTSRNESSPQLWF